MPLIRSVPLTLLRDFENKFDQLLTESTSPNHIIVVDQIFDSEGMKYPEFLFSCNFNNHKVVVQGVDNNEGALLISYYRTERAFNADYDESGAYRKDYLNESFFQKFVQLKSTYYGPEVLTAAATSVLDFFLEGGAFPDMFELQRRFPKLAVALSLAGGLQEA